MAALNLFAKQNRPQREEDFDPAYYGTEEENEIAAEEKPAYEKPAATARTASFSMSHGVPSQQMKLIRPTCYADGEVIAGYLKQNHPVFMHFESINKEDAHDLVRFLDGVLFAIDGHLQPVSENTFILTPSGIEVAEEKLNEGDPDADENGGYGFAGFSGIGGYGY